MGVAQLDQLRAKHAWETVKKGKSDKNFKRHAKKTPARIVASGLGQAIAFLNAKSDKPDLVTELTDWLLAKRRLSKETVLIQAIINGDANFLRRATDETLAYLAWVNRFAESELRDQGVHE